MANGLRIGLIHQGWPAGSFVTTLGLQRAFERQADVLQIVRLPAGQLDDLPRDLDFLFVEGYPGGSLWRKIQTLSTTKYFWWLSTNFGRMTWERLAASSFDHVFGNSAEGIRQLSNHKPATLLPLAFDRTMAQQARPLDRYRCQVTYLGISGHKSRAQLRVLLQPATRFDLAIWGKGWQFTRFRPFYQGVLPADDIAPLYASAQVILGMTEPRQQSMGMINNRVFEALGCGGTLLADHFDGLEMFFGDRLLYTRSPDQTREWIEEVLARPDQFKKKAKENQHWILEHHTYDHRCQEILQVYRDGRR